jgi:hypothetical protein
MALDGDEWSASRLSRALPRGKDPWRPLYRRLWAPEAVWTQRIEEKCFCLCRVSNLDRLVVQSVARHYWLSYPGSPSAQSSFVLPSKWKVRSNWMIYVLMASVKMTDFWDVDRRSSGRWWWWKFLLLCYQMTTGRIARERSGRRGRSFPLLTSSPPWLFMLHACSEMNNSPVGGLCSHPIDMIVATHIDSLCKSISRFEGWSLVTSSRPTNVDETPCVFIIICTSVATWVDRKWYIVIN